MRVFHFLNKSHALDDIRKRRLKVSILNDLNDPFEFLFVVQSDPQLRASFQRFKDSFSEKYGLICFSLKWANPVLWSHYAARHTGICLGFDIPDDRGMRVRYRQARSPDTFYADLDDNTKMMDAFRQILSTKFSHWRYENEVRTYAKLENIDADTGFYFTEFSADMKLRQIVVGPLADASHSEISDSLCAEDSDVEVFKTRLAFRSFKVVRNKNDSLWK